MASAKKSKKDFKLKTVDDSLYGLFPPTGFQEKDETNITFSREARLERFTDAEPAKYDIVGIVCRMDRNEFGPRPNMSRNYIPQPVPTHWYIGRLEKLVTTKDLEKSEPVVTATLTPYFGLSTSANGGEYRVWSLGEVIERQQKPQVLSAFFLADLYKNIPAYMKKLGAKEIKAIKVNKRIVPLDYPKSVDEVLLEDLDEPGYHPL